MAAMKPEDIEIMDRLEIHFGKRMSQDFEYWEAYCGEFCETGETKAEALENLLFDPMLKKPNLAKES